MKYIQGIVGSSVRYLMAHKTVSVIGCLILIALAYGGYQLLPASTDTTYRVVSVKKDQTITSSVEGTGQVSASSQIDLTSKASGNVVYVGVTSGQEVKAGTLIAQIDTRDAELSLESARISLEKLTAPADDLEIAQAENAVKSAIESQDEAYESGLNAVSDAFSDSTAIITEYYDLLYDPDGYLYDQKELDTNGISRTYQNKAGVAFDQAKREYEKVLTQYRESARSNIATSSTSKLITDTYNMLQLISQAVKNGKIAVDYRLENWPNDYATEGASAKEDLTTWISETNTHLKSILAAKSSIESAARTITEKTETLADLKEGTDPLDIKTQELSLKQKEYDYEDYFIRAPFDGIIANLSVRKYDPVSSGSSIGTFITKERVAEVSLNEVDVASVSVGQEAALTFDALDGVTATGTVLEVDLVGTASQGVVSYDVRIGFATNDERIKPGMSANAIITTSKKENLVTVSSSAIKSSGDTQYVEVLDNVTTKGTTITTSESTHKVTVTTGISDDTSTEIVTGLTGGEVVVTGTVSSSSSSSSSSGSSSSKSATSIIGGSGSGGPPGGGAAMGGIH